jgi:Tfp pilus assembly protein PilN
MNPDEFLWHRYRHHQRRRRLMRQIDVATWLLLAALALGLLYVLWVNR